MKKIITLFTAAVLLTGAAACGKTTETIDYINPHSELWSIRYDTDSTADMEIDFSKKDGGQVQNVKKIDMFSPTWDFVYGETVNYASLEQLKYLQEIKSEAFRIDMVFGGGGIGNNSLINGGVVTTDNAWNRVNQFSDALEDNGVLPYFIMLGIPNYAQAEGGNNRSYPDMEKYADFCSKVSGYFKEKNRRVIYETWNEPDLNATAYWTSGMPQFIDMSVAAASAYKKGDPDAYVAELGLCWPVTFCKDNVPSLNGTLWDYYMKKTEEAGNTIDAFTWHYYGDSSANMEGCANHYQDFSYYKEAVRASINRDNDEYALHTMTQHVTEFSPAATGSGILVQTGLVPKLYDSIGIVLDSTDISRFSWASYLMGEFALINPYSWQKNPVFYVLWSYGRLPVAPAFVTVSEDTEETFGWRTGVDSHRAGAVIYNKTLNPTYTISESYQQRAEDSREINVKLKNIPFDAKSMKVYLIDNEHVSHNTADDEPYVVMDLDDSKVKDGDVTLDLKIPGNAAFYIEADDGQGIAETDEKSNLHDHIVRKDYYYEERADLMPYTDIYENSFDVSLGMLGHAEGQTALSVTMEEMNEFAALDLDWNVWGEHASAGANKALGVRIDYHTSEGYVSSAEYCYRNYKGGFAYEGWGTGKAADGAKQFGSSENGSYQIPLMQNAPSGWDGRIQITYFMKDAGTGAAAKIRTSGVN